MAFGAASLTVFAADVRESGVFKNGRYWEYLKRFSIGETQMQNSPDGSCTCKWKDIRNAEFSSGIRFESPLDFSELTSDYVYRYESDFDVSGDQSSVYYGVHGWLSEGKGEFFVIDGWKNWRPPSDGVQGKVGVITVDGVKYDVFQTIDAYRPKNELYEQYWSVRQENAMPDASKGTVSGSVNLLTHLRELEKLKLTYYGTFLNEAGVFASVYSPEGSTCEGSFSYSRNELTIETPAFPAETSVTVSEPAVLRGDADCTGVVDISDAVLLAKFVSGDSTAKISDRGLINGDVDGKEGITDDDVTYLLRALVNLVKL